ncbi:MAG: hypothetical protein FVQ79_00735 [Planctomycetes bacterium]|nr:hypothetical protein [Planctomycetota bacterium]
MFGHHTFGEGAFGELRFADSEAAKIIAQYYSDHGFTSEPGDMPADQYFEANVNQPLLFSRNMISDRIGGFVVLNNGAVELNNNDGALDSLLQTHGIDGRRVVVKVGRPDFNYDDFGVIFDGIASGWDSDEKVLRISLFDKLRHLERPIQPNTYFGTGGIEGGDDLKGKPKPLCFGEVFNIPAIQVDTANLIYQVHDGQINNVVAVYDRGVALAKVGGTPVGGEYSEDVVNGTFTLGGSPAGTVTADVRGSADPGYVVVTSDIVKHIIKTYGGLKDVDLDLNSFLIFFNDNTASVGIWLDTSQHIINDVINELMIGVGGFFGSDRFGKAQVGVFNSPSGQPKFTYTDEEISDIEQEPLPSSVNPAAWRIGVGYKRSYTVQTDIAGSVSASHRAFISQGLRAAFASNSTAQAMHLLATNPPVIPGLFVSEVDATAEAQRLVNLYSVDRNIYRIKTKYSIYDLKLNDVVRLDYPRWDLSGGKDGRIVSIDLDAKSNNATIRVFA